MRTLGAILCTLLLSGFCAPRSGAAVYHSDGSAASVQALHHAAHDGDTITLPAGTFTWSTEITITKGITLKGANVNAEDDLTIIKDNLPVRSSAITARMTSATQSFRLTGITFTYGPRTRFGSTDGFIHLISQAAQPNQSMRVDHCHFASLYQGKMIWVSGWVYGVADHNLIKLRPATYAFNINHPTWGGPSQGNGNGSWADYPWYGTEKFFFVEDNTIIGTAAGLTGALDTQHGGRWVARHNYWQNALPSGHGTEGGAHRGQRVSEFYDNTINITISWSSGGQRSGTSMWHDNTLTGIESNAQAICGLANYRETPARAYPIWGIADGTSPWDVNDTEGNGTYIEGHAPFLFGSGTATANGRRDGSIGTLIDHTKNWTPNQWVGYSIKNTDPASASYTLGSYVIANTSNAIFYYYYSAPDTRAHLVFNAGDTYQIHRVLVMMDQNGRGKGDLVIDNPNPVNTATGTRSWPHQALEPCYSWNNVHTPTGHSYGFKVAPGQPTTKPGIDFFNLGAGFPAHTTPSEVSSTYTARLNGVDYVGTFVYPHPLTALPIGTARAVVTDFNGEGSPDYVLQRASTHQTGIWYLDNNVYASSAFGPTLTAGWKVMAAADFNGGGKPDYLLFNARTGQTGIYYLNNSVYAGSAYGPTLPRGWELVGAADFNGDSNPDYLLCNGSTQQTGIYYLNNNIYIGSGYGPTLPPGWILVAPADFNSDGNPDYLLYNGNTHQTGIYYLNNSLYAASAYGPALPALWTLVGAADFNGDGKPDYLLYNEYTQQTGIYYLNNNVYVSSAWGPTVSGWSLFGP